MKKDNILYKNVYDSLVTQIYRGCYQRGEYLPSFEQLCGEFGVSNITIRKAVHLLVESHYVHITKSKRFQVIFDVTNPEYEKSYILQLAARKKAVLDTFDMLAVMMPVFFTEGAMLCGEKELDVLSQIMESMNPWTQSLADLSVSATEFMLFAPSRLNNPVLMDVLKAANQFVMVSYLPSFEQPYPFAKAFMSLRVHFRRVVQLVRQRDNRGLSTTIHNFYVYGRQKMQEYVDALTQELSVTETTAFHWNVNGSNPHFSLDLANTLTGQIEDGLYESGDFLPSPAMLANQFSISESAVRKTIAVLNRIGIVETVNGKGTRVCLLEPREAGSVADALVRRVMGLGVYSAQVLLLIGKEVAQNLDALEQGQTLPSEEPCNESVGRLVEWLISRIANTTLQACCQQLGLAVLFGYRISCLETDAVRTRELSERCKQVCRSLGENDRERFGEGLQQLLFDVYQFLLEKSVRWDAAEEQELALSTGGKA